MNFIVELVLFIDPDKVYPTISKVPLLILFRVVVDKFPDAV